MSSIQSKSTSGFTKLGFSKSGFGCCGHFNTCEMGLHNCFYETIDPEVKEYCACYKRHHTPPKPVTELILSDEIEETVFFTFSEDEKVEEVVESKKNAEEPTFHENGKGQLSLF